MHKSSQQKPYRTARTAALKGTALALLVAAGLAGATLLTTNSTPVIAAQNTSATQVLTTTTFSELAARVSPAVVSVRVTRGVKENVKDEETSGSDRPYEEFFKRFFNDPESAKRFGRRFGKKPSRPHSRGGSAQGSGFVISPKGFVVTNEHVVADAEKITVVMNDGKEYLAKVVGSDARSDLAVLKTQPDNTFSAVKFSEAETRVGDWVMAVGNPFGLGGSVSTGIVSARGRQIGSGPYDDFLQIDAAVNRGNSGGPAFNLAGDVIGINTAIFSPNGGSVGVGFAIPASLARNVVAEILDKGKVTRGWLGVAIQTVTPDIAASLGLDEPSGALVSEVTQNGPADDSGIQPGDTILQVNGNKIDSPRDLARKVADITPGATTRVLVMRDGKEKTIKVEIGTLPSREKLAKRMQRDEWQPTYSNLGLGVAPAREVDGDVDARGLVITRVKPGSEADTKGLRTGDRIMAVGGTDVNSPAALERLLSAASKNGQKAVLVQVRNRAGNRFIALQLDKV
ncbi:MAG: Do family serine endopeptidase [Hyphomicrobiales bacterium]